MPRSHQKALAIAQDKQQSQLSKEQKTFNSRIKQIERLREQLAAWDAARMPFQQRYVAELQPLQAEAMTQRARLVKAFDQVLHTVKLSKRDSGMLVDWIVSLAGQLVAEQNDPDMKALYNQYTGSDFDQEQQGLMSEFKEMFAAEFGVDLGDDLDPASPDDLLRDMQEKMQEMRKAEEERQAARPKSAKALAKEARQQAEAAKLTQSIREIYRKLAAALHPDRETDPAERERKTELMKRVNAAYEANNLLQLLELQLELEHISQDDINNFTPERLKHYNKILNEQIAELNDQLLHIETGFRLQFRVDPEEPLFPATLSVWLDRRIDEQHNIIASIKNDLGILQQPKLIKPWLKQVREVERELMLRAALDY